MSYTVEVPTTVRDTDFGTTDHVAVTTFAGGDLGPMVQISVGGGYATLTRDELAKLVEVLQFARERSLVEHPDCPSYTPPRTERTITCSGLGVSIVEPTKSDNGGVWLHDNLVYEDGELLGSLIRFRHMGMSTAVIYEPLPF